MGKDSGLAPRPLRTFSLFATYPFFSNGSLFLSGCQPKKQECITESLNFLSILVVGSNRDETLFSPQTSQSHGEFIGHICCLAATKYICSAIGEFFHCVEYYILKILL